MRVSEKRTAYEAGANQATSAPSLSEKPTCKLHKPLCCSFHRLHLPGLPLAIGRPSLTQTAGSPTAHATLYVHTLINEHAKPRRIPQQCERCRARHADSQNPGEDTSPKYLRLLDRRHRRFSCRFPLQLSTIHIFHVFLPPPNASAF